MGWVLFSTAQVLLTSVTLGVLQKNGIISVDPRRIHNPTARSLFEGALDIGESVAVKVERLVGSLSGK